MITKDTQFKMADDKIVPAAVMTFEAKVDYSTDGIVSKKVIQKDKGSITLFAFDKDQKLSEHTVSFDALVQVLEGTGEIFIDGKSHIVKAGECIIMPAKTPHAVNAIERFKMLLTMIKE